jgi:hypothetical protein
MPPLVLLGIVIAVPVLLIFVLRINAAIVFLSLCLGSVLVHFVNNDAKSFANFMSGNKIISGYGITLALLLLPAILTMVMMIATVHGKIRSVINILPALAASLLAVLLAVPLFAPGLRGAIDNTVLWKELLRAEVLIVGFGSFISLMFLWLQRPKRHDKEKHRRH